MESTSAWVYTNPNGSTFQFQEEQDNPNGRRIHFDYGPTDEMADALGRLAAIRDDDAGSSGDTLVEYAYLGLDRIVVEDYVEPDVRLDYDSGSPGEYAGFDRFGRVIDHRWYTYGTATDRDRFAYGDDRASNRLYRENALASGQDELYAYDALDQLITFRRGDLNANKDGITGTPVREEDWSLDMTGNWPEYVRRTSGNTEFDQTRTHNPVNEITGITAATGTDWADPVHDRNGNMITMPKPVSVANSLTAKYDAWNRLVEVKDGETVIARYDYDGLNRRITSHIDSRAPSNPTGIDTYVHYFHNSSWQILETRQSDSPPAQPETLQPKHQYVWSQRYIDAALLRDENTDANGLCDDQRLYYLSDANFNVTALLDATGDPLERYVYSPYGVVTIYDATWTNIRSTSSYANVTLYTGREFDGETDLYYYRHRYYDATLGRFVNRDPLMYEAGDSNLYAYVRNTPVNQVDSSGLQFPRRLPWSWQSRPTTCGCTPRGSVMGRDICAVKLLNKGGRDFTQIDPTTGGPYPVDAGLSGMGILVSSGATSGDDVLDKLNKSCCTLYLLGHQGGARNPGGIVTYPDPNHPDAAATILPDPAFSNKLRKRFGSQGNKCRSCSIDIVACGVGPDVDPALGQAARQRIANETGCVVCGSKLGGTDITDPILDPCRGGPKWNYSCVGPQPGRALGEMPRD